MKPTKSGHLALLPLAALALFPAARAELAVSVVIVRIVNRLLGLEIQSPPQ